MLASTALAISVSQVVFERPVIVAFPAFTFTFPAFNPSALIVVPSAFTLVTFNSLSNANPVLSTVKFVSSSFNLTDILLSFSSSIAIPLPAVYVSPPPIAYLVPLILSSDTLLFSSLVASTLEPASTLKLLPSPSENSIFVSLPVSFTLVTVNPWIVPSVPGIGSPFSSNSVLVIKLILLFVLFTLTDFISAAASFL